MLPFRTLTFAAALTCAALTSVPGQSIVGRVIDGSTRATVAGALVVAVDNDGREYGRAITDTTGLFRFDRLARARKLRVTALSYASFESALELEKLELQRVDVPLSPVGVPAAPLTVTARRLVRDPRLAEFYQRMDFQERAGFGRFLHREEIDSTALPALTDYLTRFARVPIDGAGDRAVVVGRGNCGKVQLFVDGVKTDLPINAIPVGTIEGAEVYRSRSELPMEYSYGQAVNCGALLVWTRTGPARRSTRFVSKALIIALAIGLSLVPILDLR
jgi:hypothetical protein